MTISTIHPASAEALAPAVGQLAFLTGYPLVEIVRTCRLQTRNRQDPATRRDLNTLAHIRRPATAANRDVVTPANDLLYTSAWIHLTDGPQRLTVPSAQLHGDRYFVLALYDAWTENFQNLGAHNCAPEGETVLLLGPGQNAPPGCTDRVVRCPTHLVWLIGRILVTDVGDLAAARALQDDIDLRPWVPDTPPTAPASVLHWFGEPQDTLAAYGEGRLPLDSLAEAFFTNLCRALAEQPPIEADRSLWRYAALVGIGPNPDFRWEALPPAVRAGLALGLGAAARLVTAVDGPRSPAPWSSGQTVGRYGQDHLARACTAYLGLGALAREEAVYASGRLDADLQPLDGHHRYTLHFDARALPPVQAFWSVTLYGADRFLHPNSLGRHAIGDRSRHLRHDPDGGLTLLIGHEAPADTSNWLPAPAGPFYLVLRLYRPTAALGIWPFPPLQRALPSSLRPSSEKELT